MPRTYKHNFHYEQTLAAIFVANEVARLAKIGNRVELNKAVYLTLCHGDDIARWHDHNDAKIGQMTCQTMPDLQGWVGPIPRASNLQQFYEICWIEQSIVHVGNFWRAGI